MFPVLHIRWMIRKDLPDVMAIENMSFPDPWSVEAMAKELGHQRVVPFVVEKHGVIVGYMMFEVGKQSIALINLAVHPDHRREGIGSVRMAKLMTSLSAGKRERLTVLVKESNLPALTFFKSHGFRATRIVHPDWDLDDDGIEMEFELVDVDLLMDQLIFG